MSWNYRVVRRKDPLSGYVFRIHEAYYSKDNETVESITAEPIEALGETLEDLICDFQMQELALHLPVLDYETRKPIPKEDVLADSK